MSYDQTLDYLFRMLPMYQRIGKQAYKKDLSNTIALCQALGNPQHAFKSIHIAGTNGKGSVSHILTSLLMGNGYKTGLYTSPHLLDFRERIRINGKPVSKEFVVKFTADMKDVIEQINPSFFEITVAMAFKAFEEAEADFAVIETGLGGRLDSTNIINPVLSLITNISLEHEQMLGDSLEKIAFEKAGIIKTAVPVVIGKKQKEIQAVFEKIAREKEAPLFYAEDLVKLQLTGSNKEFNSYRMVKNDGTESHLETELLGAYQGENIGSALAGLELLKEKGVIENRQYNTDALKNIKKLSGLRGRLDFIQKKPDIVCDISHNPVAIEMLLGELAKYSFNSLHIVLGMSNDKKTDTILALFPKDAKYYFVRPDVPRGLPEKSLQSAGEAEGLKGKAFASVKEGIVRARSLASPEDLILITGSAFVVAEALSFLETETKN